MLRKFLPVARIFMRICNSKTFSPTELLGECHQPTDQTLMENPGGSRKEPWWGFRRQSPNLFWLAIKLVIVTLKNYIYGLKSYASSKPTCFFCLINRLMAENNIM